MIDDELNQTEKINQLLKVLETFNHYNVRYCLLRNYEFLFDSSFPIESLDTTISQGSINQAEEIFFSLGFIKRSQQFSLRHQAYFKLIELDKISFDIQVGGVYWNDLQYLNETIFDQRVLKNNLYVLSNNHLYLMLIIHSILGKRYFKEKYQNILTNTFVDEKSISAHLTKIFTKSITKNLLLKAKQKQLLTINPYYPLITFLIKQPSRLITLGALFIRWVIQRKNIFNLAPLISIVGPDGAGKSSSTSYLQDFLKLKGRKSVIIYTGRGRNHILPITIIGRKFKQIEKQQERPSESTSKKKTSKKKSLVYTLIYNIIYNKKIIYTITSVIFTVDLLLRYVLTILPSKINGKIVLTDRYCTDIVLMKHVPFWVKKYLLILFPKPTISIYLYNDPEILHLRRPEEPVEELNRQMKIFKRFSYHLQLKTDSLENNQTQIAAFVFKELLRKWW